LDGFIRLFYLAATMTDDWGINMDDLYIRNFENTASIPWRDRRATL
jgi:hypothetical protein